MRNLSGTQRTINAYFGELLDGLPGELVQFMLRTAILNRLCAPLCEHVTSMSSGRELLASIEKRQLLLVPLDQEGRWYRYHPLLAEYLTKRLEAELGNEIAGLSSAGGSLVCVRGIMDGRRPAHDRSGRYGARAELDQELCDALGPSKAIFSRCSAGNAFSRMHSCGANPSSSWRSPGEWVSR